MRKFVILLLLATLAAGATPRQDTRTLTIPADQDKTAKGDTYEVPPGSASVTVMVDAPCPNIKGDIHVGLEGSNDGTTWFPMASGGRGAEITTVEPFGVSTKIDPKQTHVRIWIKAQEVGCELSYSVSFLDSD